MFIIVGIFMVYQQFTTEGKVWPLIGIVISVVLIIGYLKQAFNK